MKPLLPPLPNLNPGQPQTLGHVPFAAQAMVLVELVGQKKSPAVHISVQDKDAATLAATIAFLAPEITLLQLPAWDTLAYDRVSPSATIQAQRIATLAALSAQGSKPYILLTTLNAAAQLLPPKAVVAQARYTISKGGSLNREKLFDFLTHHGYSRTGKVMEAGEFAVRGSLIDLFAPGQEEAVRIDLFDDEVESLRRFDPLTQISGDAIDMLELGAVGEVLLQPETISRFRTRYLELFGAVTKEDPLYENISNSRAYAGMEHWLPLFYPRLSTLSEYTPGATLVADYRIDALQDERWETIADYYQARQTYRQSKDSAPYHPIAPELLFQDREAFARSWAAHAQLVLTPFAAPESLPVLSSPQLHQRRHEEGKHPGEIVLAYLNGKETPILLAAASAGSAERIRKILQLADTPPLEKLASMKASPALAVLPLEHGFESPALTILTEQDMFGERIIRTTKKKKKSDVFMQEAASFLEDEYIVHREHGIGKFEGLVTLEVNNTRHDCLKLIYDGGDKLFLPVENIDLVSRYGHADDPVPLDKLGGVAWQKRKAVLKKRLKMAAEALLKVAAERAAKPAPAMAADAGAYDEFCERFPYSETEDQLSAIEDVRTDLASGHAMDRLICGDVGFGKTEVALRAAFIAASAGYQVAVIAPTTLLVRQHFATFRERFRGLPFELRMLSRLTSAKDAAETKKLLPEGKVDIVVGTHALLATGVQFKNLGLLIVDEEQHFGVAQKEKLKQLKHDVHVLTLSATPIPRTLQMSLAGVRELSLITTPPIDRLAVRSYVMPFDPVIVREAILREQHRGGKTFYVTPRIKYMAELKQKLSELVPEAKVAAAHGQMSPTDLDRTMNEFYDGKFDVLLSTAIIESGIDIPTANTMIIDHAEMLGLAQLYQLRGRVGRSKQRAYAYLTLPHGKKITREAERRLEVMQQLDSLGAGFQLASHDMDIRGFGNLLGEEQSGHIKEVGIELYQTMLEEAVADMKRKRMPGDESLAPEAWSPQLNLGMSVLIPETYIEDLPLRLSLYRRAASLDSQADLDDFAAELVDRFGPMPMEVEHFLSVLAIKAMAKQAGIARMDAGPKGIVIAFREAKFAAPDALIGHIAKQPKRIKLRADQTLFFGVDLENDNQRLDTAAAIAREIAGLLPPKASELS